MLIAPGRPRHDNSHCLGALLPIAYATSLACLSMSVPPLSAWAPIGCRVVCTIWVQRRCSLHLAQIVASGKGLSAVPRSSPIYPTRSSHVFHATRAHWPPRRHQTARMRQWSSRLARPYARLFKACIVFVPPPHQPLSRSQLPCSFLSRLPSTTHLRSCFFHLSRSRSPSRP
jgi:hypothetical protein